MKEGRKEGRNEGRKEDHDGTCNFVKMSCFVSSVACHFITE